MSKSKKLRHRGPIVPESAAKTFIQVTPDLFRPVEVEPRKTPEMLTIRCQVEGISPLLLDAMPPEMVESALIRKQKAQIDTSEDLDVRAARSLYRELWDEDGALGIPQENLFACLREAGRNVPLAGKEKVSTKEETRLPAVLSIEETYLRFTVGTSLPVTDIRRGIMKTSGKGIAVGIVRPFFKEWGLCFTLEVDLTTEGVTEQTARKLVQVAGKRVGLCSFNPLHRGPFGRFKIAQWAVVGVEYKTLAAVA